jgi:hypothetical protein
MISHEDNETQRVKAEREHFVKKALVNKLRKIAWDCGTVMEATCSGRMTQSHCIFGNQLLDRDTGDDQAGRKKRGVE